MNVNLAFSILMVSQMVFAQAPLKNEPIKTEMMNEQKMKIEIWSDVMCPFC
jgi:hypothetical protein